MAAKLEYHGKTVQPDGKSTQHMHLLFFPTDFLTGDVEGTVSFQKDVIITIDGADGHWHYPISDIVNQAIDDHLARKAKKEHSNG